VTIATTLTDASRYPKRRVAELYGMRWEIEEYQPQYTSSARFYQPAA
jgi:hypothetical protein